MSGLITHVFWIGAIIRLADRIYEWRHPEPTTPPRKETGTGVAEQAPPPEHTAETGGASAVSSSDAAALPATASDAPPLALSEA